MKISQEIREMAAAEANGGPLPVIQAGT